MTATHDRRSEPRAASDALAEWGARSAFGPAKGWPWWAAVLLALGLSILGAFIDMKLSNDIDKVFEGAYILGCLGAVCLVRRRNLFGPMVQPPLILAVTIPVVVLLTKGMPSGSGTVSKLITLVVPLVTGFPTMAATTGITLVIGGIRYLMQRKPNLDLDDWDDARPKPRRRTTDRDAERGPARKRPTGSGSGRPAGSRPADDDREGPRERTSSRGRGEPSGRSGRSNPDRPGQPRERDSGRVRRPSGDGDRSAHAERAERRGRGDRGERGDRRERSGRAERGDRGEPSGRAERGERRERGERGERGQRREGSDRRERSGRREGSDRRQSPRGSEPRDRGRRPARDEGRRQPPRRRDDD